MAARNVGSSIGVSYCLKTTGCPNRRALNSPGMEMKVVREALGHHLDQLLKEFFWSRHRQVKEVAGGATGGFGRELALVDTVGVDDDGRGLRLSEQLGQADRGKAGGIDQVRQHGA